MSNEQAPDDFAQTVSASPLAAVITFPHMTEHAAPLPEPLSSFVGRQGDVAHVVGLLTDPAVRLLTLTGPGGIGKTRLAMAAATAARDAFADGVAFVALDVVRRADEVIPAIAQALGLRERSDQDQQAQLYAVLDRKDLLLVLDNFEQILEAGPEVAALLSATKNVTALVTSRAPLRVDGERALLIPPLSLAGERANPADLLAADAGRLFVERARARDPGFALDEETAPIIADICTQLDGLPLAIELAAAQANVLPPRQLATRLERRLPLLMRGARDAPTRHGTMRNAIAWSYDLLSESEQRVFRKLAVFVDGCTLEAAEWVCADPQHPMPGVYEVVAALVDQCLLVRERGVSGEARFRMLETIREFGLEQLATADEDGDARARHAQSFLLWTRAMRPLASVHAQQGPLDQLLAEHANLQEALRWLETHGPAADFAEMVADLGLSWYGYGAYREGQIWLERALARREQESGPVQARLLIGYAGVLFAQGDISQTVACLEEALAFLRLAGDPLDLAIALILRGAAWNSEGNYAAAEISLRETLLQTDQLTDPVLRTGLAGRALGNLAGAALGQRDFARATAYGEEALRLYDGLHLDLAESQLLMDLGTVAHEAGDYELAAERWREAIGLVGERGDMRMIADALSGIACVATSSGEHSAALLLFGAEDALRERVGAATYWPTEALAKARSLAVLRNDLGEQMAATMLAEGRTLSLADAVAVASAVVQPVATDAASSGSTLTRRESEVLRLLAEQRTDQEIADALFLSRRTVSWHVRSILSKLKASSRGDAVSRALARSLI